MSGQDRDPLTATLAVFDDAATPGTPLTASEVAAELDCTRRTAYDRLNKLAEQGVLRTKKVGARGRVWWREPESNASNGDENSAKDRDGLERQQTPLHERERTLREVYEVIAEPDREFKERIEALLGIVRETLGTDYATLSRVEGDDYVFEVIDAPTDADLEAGDTVPLETTNCERTVSTARTVVLNDVERDAPEMAGRAGNADWGISCYLGAPVSVGGEVYGTFCFYDMEARTESFSDWEVTLVDLLASWVSQELERRQYTERLATLNDLNDVAWEITDAIIDQSSRESIEATVCEQLADADSYAFAWVADVDPGTERLQSRTEAGVEGFLADVELSADPDESDYPDPVGESFRTGEIQVSRDVFDDPTVTHWRERAEAYGFRSFAAIPIVHEGTMYGVLGLCSERAGAFDEAERTVVGRLGEVVGHAIAAVDRKQALMSDELVELEVSVPAPFESLDVDASFEGRITIEEMVPLVDDEYLVYGTTSAGADAVSSLVDALPHWQEVAFQEEGGSAFQVRLSDPPVLSAVASLGGSVKNAVIEDGEYRLTVHLSPSVGVRQLLDAVQEYYPDAEMVTRRQITRTEDATDRASHVLSEELTDRQRAALRAAHHSGFFAWPRERSGEEVAETLDVSAPTFHQHLRIAQEKVFDALLDRDDA